jgi:ATP phosphoribosyltransferase regulatory subunit
VLHTRADRPHATREPLQFGAEIYGHAGLEADLEAQLLALEGLSAAGVTQLSVDMADVRIVGSLLAGAKISPVMLARIHAALASKDAGELASLAASLQGELSAAARQGLLALLQFYGDEKVLLEAEKAFKALPDALNALQNLKWLATHVGHLAGDVKIGFDLADLRGYAYYSGTRFAIYGHGQRVGGQGAELVRGGRYDEVGAVFGRNRPAAGFSLDLKELVSVLLPKPLRPAIRAPWGEDAGLRAAIAKLRAGGETVVCVLPGHEHEVDEFDCDRELAGVAGQWQVRPLGKAAA